MALPAASTWTAYATSTFIKARRLTPRHDAELLPGRVAQRHQHVLVHDVQLHRRPGVLAHVIGRLARQPQNSKLIQNSIPDE